MAKVRVLRVIQYVGDADKVQQIVERSLHGTKVVEGMTIRTATVGMYPEALSEDDDRFASTHLEATNKFVEATKNVFMRLYALGDHPDMPQTIYQEIKKIYMGMDQASKEFNQALLSEKPWTKRD